MIGLTVFNERQFIVHIADLSYKYVVLYQATVTELLIILASFRRYTCFALCSEI